MAFTARVLQICADAKTVFKDRGGGEFSNDTIVLYINAALEEMERRGAFKTIDTFDMTVDTYVYDLASEFSDLVAPISLGWKSSSATNYSRLEHLHSLQKYFQMKQYEDSVSEDVLTSSYTSPTYVVFDQMKAYVWPAPTETVVNGFELYYRSSATRITDSIEPPTPASWDLMYVWYAVYMGFLGDIPSKNTPQLSQAYKMKFEESLERYLHGVQPGRVVLRPDR